ncbi:MAG: hypothetical protein JO040_01670 [Gemmatimonadetes bacterium]|nr:hypothetical protein [Gemmatimonadota bacterium]
MSGLTPEERGFCDRFEETLEQVIAKEPPGGHTSVIVEAERPLTEPVVAELRGRFVAKGWADLSVAHWLGNRYQVVLRCRRDRDGRDPDGVR